MGQINLLVHFLHIARFNEFNQTNSISLVLHELHDACVVHVWLSDLFVGGS